MKTTQQHNFEHMKWNYKGYTIKTFKSEAHPGFRVTDPMGKTWTEVAVNVQTAKKWIDWQLAELREQSLLSNSMHI